MINLQLLRLCHIARHALVKSCVCHSKRGGRDPKKETTLPTTGLSATRRYLTGHGLVLLTAFLVIVLPPLVAAPLVNWVTLEDCQLVPNEANDGDSFHVRAKDREYIFRLYFVDAPEIDAASPARLIEQAKHFGISVPQVIEVGEAAKSFASDKMSERFTVLTRMANAMGRSKTQRFYALVKTKEGDLGELLVENGLARSYGRSTKLPDLGNSNSEWQKLEELENEAKQQRVGGWGINFGRLSVRIHRTNRDTALTATNLSGHPQPVTPRSESPAAVNTPEAVSSVAASVFPVNQRSSKLDVNNATETQLEAVPGIGPGLAGRIIAARPFKNADDLRKVKGIGTKKRYEAIRPYFN